MFDRVQSWRSEHLRGAKGLAIAATAVFMLVAGIGAAASLFGSPSAPRDTARPAAKDPALARLENYTRTIQSAPAGAAADTKMLPDVNTMIERLAARLATAPDDSKGWRMLGWSYYNTERYKEAAEAYSRAISLDPGSSELKAAYEDAKAKAAQGDGSAPLETAPARADAAGKGAGGPSPDQVAAFEAMPQHERGAAIRAMVDGLAGRLESSPRDVEGWMRLMRSRVVLGEKEVAASALRKALDIFKDDPAASARIAATAGDLGLKAH